MRKYILYDEYVKKFEKDGEDVFFDTEEKNTDGKDDFLQESLSKSRKRAVRKLPEIEKNEAVNKTQLNTKREYNYPVIVVEPEAVEPAGSPVIQPEIEKKPQRTFEIDNAAQTKTRNGTVRQGIGLFGLAAVVIFFAVSVILANMLAAGISVGNMISLTQTVRVAEQNFYAVQAGAYTVKDDALSKAEEITVKGGSGCLLIQDGLYYVLAHIYFSEEDADSVINQLTQSGQTAGKLKITLPAVALNVNIKSSNLQILQNGVDLYKIVLLELNSLSVNFDKGTDTVDSVKIKILALNDRLKNTINDVDGLMTESNSNRIITLKAGLNNILNTCKKLSDIDARITSSELKLAFSNVLFEYRSFLISQTFES